MTTDDYNPFNSVVDINFGLPWAYTDWNQDGRFELEDGDGLQFVDVEEYVGSAAKNGGFIWNASPPSPPHQVIFPLKRHP